MAVNEAVIFATPRDLGQRIAGGGANQGDVASFRHHQVAAALIHQYVGRN